MKKLLLVMLATAAMLTGCKKEDSTNTEFVKSIELPPLTEQFSTGSSVTIKGSGFTKTDVISFRAKTRSGDIDASITEVTASQITFIVPSGLTPGENSIFLKRNGAEQLLGKLAISEILPDAKLYGVCRDDNDRYSICEIDRSNGNLTEIKALSNGENIIGAVCIGQVLYGIYWPKNEGDRQIVSINLSTKAFKTVAVADNVNCLGVIDGKLHALTSPKNTLKLSTVDTQSGTLSPVADFGIVPDPAAWEEADEYPFTYDARNNQILVVGWWYDKAKNEVWSRPIVLDVAQPTITLLPGFPEPHRRWENIFIKADQLYATVSRVSNYDTEQAIDEYDMYSLNSSYELDEKITTTSEWCFSWQYDAKSDMMYSAYVVSAPNASDSQNHVTGVGSFDFKTSTFKRIKHDVNIYEVVLAQ